MARWPHDLPEQDEAELRPGLRELADTTATSLRANPGTVLQVGGPRGSGRSTFLAALARRLGEDATVLHAHTSAATAPLVYAVWHAVFGELPSDLLAWLGQRGVGPRRVPYPTHLPAPAGAHVLLLDGLDHVRLDELADLVEALPGLQAHAPDLTLVLGVSDASLVAAAQRLGLADPHGHLQGLAQQHLMPPTVDPGDVAFLVGSFVRRADLDLPPAAREALVAAFEAPGFWVARAIRHAVADLAVVSRHEVPTPDADRAELDRLLGQWIAATSRWPTLRRLLRTRDDTWWRMLRLVADGAVEAGHDPEVQALFAQPGAAPWCRSFLPDARHPGHAAAWHRFMGHLRATDDRLRRWGR